MKKNLSEEAATLCLVVFVSSCSIYEHTYVVDKGSKTSEVIQNKNHFMVYWLVLGRKKVDIKEIVGETKDYQIETILKFIDCILSGITFEIYTPKTTIIKNK